VTFYLKNEQEVIITGFVSCSSRFIVRFQYNCKRNLRAKSEKFHLVAVSSSTDCDISSQVSKKGKSQDLFGEHLG